MSVSQMVDGGKLLIFNSIGCVIRKEGSKRVISKGFKTLDLCVYVEGKSENQEKPKRILFLIRFRIDEISAYYNPFLHVRST